MSPIEAIELTDEEIKMLVRITGNLESSIYPSEDYCNVHINLDLTYNSLKKLQDAINSKEPTDYTVGDEYSG